MNPNLRTLGRIRAASLALVAGCIASPAQATCEKINEAIYQIGQTSYVDVRNDDPAGTHLRSGQATGEGKLLLRCKKGPVTFRGLWLNRSVDQQVPLQVDGRDAGVAIRLSLEEAGRGITRSFPFEYMRDMEEGEEVRSDADIARYDIYRTTGPVRFGKVDVGRIAFATADRDAGAAVLFRSMDVFNLILRRPACSILPDDLNQTVALPEYNLSNFATPERATPWVPFALRVGSCADPLGLIATFRFGSLGDAEPGHSDWFTLSGPENVALELSNDEKRTMAPGAYVSMNALGDGERYDFNVRLRETRATVRGGSFRRPIRVEVEYR